MTDRNYIIVGAPVDEPLHKLEFTSGSTPVIRKIDNTLVDTLAPDPGLEAVAGTGPLTVETIGKLMVEMSEQPGMSDVLKANRAKVVKAALTLVAPDNDITAADKAAILAATDLQIAFETRVKNGGVDQNLRILVVPSDHTLKVAEDKLTQAAPAPDAEPPLTYPLDQFLMLASLRLKIEGFIRSFFTTQPPSTDMDTLQDDLVEFVSRSIDDNIFTKASNGSVDPNDIKNQILQSPVRAFHRSVGIYATNMCR